MANTVLLHATSVAAAGRAALIMGASGSGKSALALRMIGLGAQLICDDRTQVFVENGTLVARPAPNIAGLIEVRGIGLLYAPIADCAELALLVDLDTLEQGRFPPARHRMVLDHPVPLLHKVDNPSFPEALLLYLTHGRAEPQPATPD